MVSHIEIAYQGSKESLLKEIRDREWSTIDFEEIAKNKKNREQYVYLFFSEDKLYALNPVDDIKKESLPSGCVIYDIRKKNFEDLIDSGRFRIKEDWWETARSIGLGDAMWMTGATLADLNSTAVSVGNVGFPIVISVIAALRNYYKQVDEYKKRYGVEKVDPAILNQFKKSSVALAFKIAAAMAGWEVGFYAAKFVFKLLVSAAHIVPHTAIATFAFHLTFALMVGFKQGLFMVLKDIAVDKAQHGKLNHSHAYRLKLFCAGFLAGATWYGVTFVPFAGPVFKALKIGATKLSEEIKPVTTAIFRGMIALCSSTMIYAAMHPQQSIASIGRRIERSRQQAEDFSVNVNMAADKQIKKIKRMADNVGENIKVAAESTKKAAAYAKETSAAQLESMLGLFARCAPWGSKPDSSKSESESDSAKEKRGPRERI